MTMRLAGASPPLLRTGKQYVLVPTMSMAEEGLRFFQNNVSLIRTPLEELTTIPKPRSRLRAP